MYRNKGMKKTNQLKLRLSDFEKEALDLAMDIQGGETAVWIREMVMAEVHKLLQSTDRREHLQRSQIICH